MDKARAKTKIVLERNPRNLEALLVEANCRNAQKDHDGAFEYYNRALDLCGDSPELAAEVRIALALEKSRRGNTKDALAMLDTGRAPSICPAYVKFFFVRGVLQESLGDTNNAIADYERACVDVENAEGTLQFDAAKRLAALGKIDGAIVAFDQLAKKSNDGALYESVKLKFDSGRADNALVNLRGLSVNSRKSISKFTKADADFWKERRAKGEIPSDVAEWMFCNN